MLSAANYLQQLCKDAEKSGNGLDLFKARTQCELLLGLLPETTEEMNINAFLPNEVILMILQFHVLYDAIVCYRPETVNNIHVRYDLLNVYNQRKRWQNLRLVCRAWKDLADKLPVFISMTLRMKDLDLESFIRPVVQKIKAFSNIRSITIPLNHMFDGSMFGYIISKISDAKNLRELTFTSPNEGPELTGRCKSILTPSIWKNVLSNPLMYPPYDREENDKPCIETLRLEGAHFKTISHTMAKSFFRYPNPYLTTLCIPQLGIRQGHLNANMDFDDYPSAIHPFCRDIHLADVIDHTITWKATGKKTYKTSFDLGNLINLKRLEIGSMDLRCTACSLCLPWDLETLVIHYPDYTNLSIPKDIHTTCPFKTLVLKHVPEDTFYDSTTRDLLLSSTKEMSDASMVLMSSIPEGDLEFKRALECRINEGENTRSYGSSPESDAYAVFLLSHPAVQDVRWEHDTECTYRGHNTLTRSEYRKYGYHCSTFHITMATYTQRKRKKDEWTGFTIGKKKRTGAK